MTLLRQGQMVSRCPHKSERVGSIPTAAIEYCGVAKWVKASVFDTVTVGSNPTATIIYVEVAK